MAMTKFTRTSILTLGFMMILIIFSVVKNHSSSNRPLVILSTNDIHAQIDKFPQLSSAIELCRDTANVILVDAGDRWTGNAFVDLVEHYTPIYEMMNLLEYDVAIYGNHEFDKGQSYVAVANRQAQFPIISANIISDTTSFPQPLPHTIIERNGKKIAFVGVVGNYDANGHPAGKDESYEGIRFIDPHTAAAEYSYLGEECDLLVLVSHSGLERDIEFAQSPLSEGYDYIISSHSHDVASEVIEGKVISQTGSRLKNIGATVVSFDESGEPIVSHRNIPLSDYTPDTKVAEMVDQYYNNPTLNAPIGAAAEEFTHDGLCNLFAQSICERSRSEIGIYHAGGVRLESIAKGEISLATVLNIEPFGSYIATASMTSDELKELIMTKFNDKVNVGEAHYIDIIATTPYQVITNAEGDATDVIFPLLKPSQRYKVAMGDYIYKTYRGLKYTKGQISQTLITTTLEDYIRSKEAITPNNEPLQSIVPSEAKE